MERVASCCLNALNSVEVWCFDSYKIVYSFGPYWHMDRVLDTIQFSRHVLRIASGSIKAAGETDMIVSLWNRV